MLIFLAGAFPHSPPKRSLFRRAAGVLAIAFLFTSAGFAMATTPVIQAANGYLNPPSDEETLSMFTPQDAITREIEEFIQNHAVSVEMRSKPEYSESRPHLKIPESQRNHNLTGGTLMGPGKVAVPPFVWSERGGKSLVSISYLGANLCGHPGIVHGGLLATLLDEGLARCCFAALPNKVGMTANLNINYRSPAPADAFVVLRAKTTKVDGRKAWVEGHIETLVGEGEKPVVLVEASALFIEPRQAAVSGYFILLLWHPVSTYILIEDGKSLSSSINGLRKFTLPMKERCILKSSIESTSDLYLQH
jgi:3'-phosphoadenosine 5'-phosphosulfate synthase